MQMAEMNFIGTNMSRFIKDQSMIRIEIQSEYSFVVLLFCFPQDVFRVVAKVVGQTVWGVSDQSQSGSGPWKFCCAILMYVF